jgi:hypothetical protein
MCPPLSRIGAATADERNTQMARSPTRSKYATAVNRESAHEMLAKRAHKDQQEAASEAEKSASEKSAARTAKRSSNRQSVGESFMKSISRAIGGQIGRQLLRGVLGSLFKR